MAKTLILYASKYGATEKYAKWLAASIHADLKKTSAFTKEDLDAYECIVFGGGLYAGRVNGLKKLTANLDTFKEKKISLFLVGMAPPPNQGIIDSLPAEIKDHAGVFYLRGAVNYEKMNWVFKILMRLITKEPKSVDYTDEKALLPLIEYVTQWS